MLGVRFSAVAGGLQTLFSSGVPVRLVGEDVGVLAAVVAAAPLLQSHLLLGEQRQADEERQEQDFTFKVHLHDFHSIPIMVQAAAGKPRRFRHARSE